MALITQIMIVIALLISMIIPGVIYLTGEKNRGRFKTTLVVNIFLFFGILLATCGVLFAGSTKVLAATSGADSSTTTSIGFIAAALVTGFACIAGGMSVAKVASAALGAISEDQSVFGKSLVYVGLAEGVCLYGLIIAFMILGKLG